MEIELITEFDWLLYEKLPVKILKSDLLIQNSLYNMNKNNLKCIFKKELRQSNK